MKIERIITSPRRRKKEKSLLSDLIPLKVVPKENVYEIPTPAEDVVDSMRESKTPEAYQASLLAQVMNDKTIPLEIRLKIMNSSHQLRGNSD